jgi:hypothetical protein
MVSLGIDAVQLHELGVVHVPAEGTLDGLDVCPVAVRGELNPSGQPRPQIVHERHRRLRRAVADIPRGDEFGVPVDSRPGPHAAPLGIVPMRLGDVAVLGDDERNFRDAVKRLLRVSKHEVDEKEAQRPKRQRGDAGSKAT